MMRKIILSLLGGLFFSSQAIAAITTIPSGSISWPSARSTINANFAQTVVGPSSSTDNYLALYSGTTGKVVKLSNCYQDSSGFTCTITDGLRYFRAYNTATITAPADVGGAAYLTDRYWIANGTNWTSRWILDSSMLSTTGGPAKKVASGTAVLGTAAITSGSCASVVTVSASGVLTTDVVNPGWQGDPSVVTGYIPSTSGGLIIYPYPTANAVNFKVCNPTAASITPGALTINWQVLR